MTIRMRARSWAWAGALAVGAIGVPGAVTAATAAGAGPAAPGRAVQVQALVNPLLDCASGENRFACTVTYSGTATRISWRVDDVTVAGWTGRTAVRSGCTAATEVAVTVTTENGSGTRTWRGCRSGPWL